MGLAPDCVAGCACADCWPSVEAAAAAATRPTVLMKSRRSRSSVIARSPGSNIPQAHRMPDGTLAGMHSRTEHGCDYGRRICRDDDPHSDFCRHVAAGKEIEWDGALS